MTEKLLIFIYVFLTFGTSNYILANPDQIYAQTQISFERHSIINKFSILIPPDWQAKSQSITDDFFILTNYEREDSEYISTNSIKTEIIFINEPLDVILENHLRASKYSKEHIIKQGNIIIDGHSAKRIWYQGNGMTFPNTISSYIPYNNDQTVIIHSYYNPENPLAVDTIERVHWSFKNLQ